MIWKHTIFHSFINQNSINLPNSIERKDKYSATDMFDTLTLRKIWHRYLTITGDKTNLGNVKELSFD